MELTAVYEEDGDWIMGYILEIPGVLTQGRTLEECKENLRDALHEFILARRQTLLSEPSPHRVVQEYAALELVA